MNIENVSENDIEELKGLARITVLKSVDANNLIKDEIINDTFMHIEGSVIDSKRVFLKCVDNNILFSNNVTYC